VCVFISLFHSDSLVPLRGRAAPAPVPLRAKNICVCVFISSFILLRISLGTMTSDAIRSRRIRHPRVIYFEKPRGNCHTRTRHTTPRSQGDLRRACRALCSARRLRIPSTAYSPRPVPGTQRLDRRAIFGERAGHCAPPASSGDVPTEPRKRNPAATCKLPHLPAGSTIEVRPDPLPEDAHNRRASSGSQSGAFVCAYRGTTASHTR